MGITEKTPFTEVWVVYAHYRPAYSVFPEETKWEKFATKKEAVDYYKAVLRHPKLIEVEEPRIYKYYQLPCETSQVNDKKGEFNESDIHVRTRE